MPDAATADLWSQQDLAPSHAAGVLALRRLVTATQQPDACVELCRCAGHHAGLGSQLHAAAVCLLQATLRGCAVVGPPAQFPEYTTHAALRRGCAGFDCYFMPLSTCTAGRNQRTIELKPDQRHLQVPLGTVANRTGLRSELLVMSTLLAYVMRPQPLLSRAVAHFAAASTAVPAGGGGGSSAPRSCVAAHVRHGDKKSFMHAAAAERWRLSGPSFWRWGVRLATMLGAQDVLFMTDDDAVASRLASAAAEPSGLPRFVLVPAPLGCFEAAAQARQAATDVLQHAQRHRARRPDANLSASSSSAAAGGAAGACAGAGEFKDEGLLVLSGMLLLSQCVGFVGTQTSNMDRVVVELMAARRFPPAVFDVLNDVYSAGASGIGEHEITTWKGAVYSVPNTRNDKRPEEHEPPIGGAKTRQKPAKAAKRDGAGPEAQGSPAATAAAAAASVAAAVVAPAAASAAAGLASSSAPSAQPAPLRLAWMGLGKENLTTMCAGDPSTFGLYRYYCEFFQGINRSSSISLLDGTKRTGPAPSADAVFLPHHCTRNVRVLPSCFGMVVRNDPPVVLVLNKMFEGEFDKLSEIHRRRRQTAVIVAMTPRVALYQRLTGVRAAFVSFGVLPRFGRYADDAPAAAAGGGGSNSSVASALAYWYDLGFTGGWHRFSTRYPFRKAIFKNGANITAPLQRKGVRIFTPPNMLPLDAYVSAISRCRMWFATSEVGDHVSTRFFEVLISGRALLLCDRNLAAYAPLGIVEGTHAAMFNTTDEFSQKVLYYSRPEHEAERRAMVAAARALALQRFTWDRVGATFVARVREGLAAFARDGPLPVTAQLRDYVTDLSGIIVPGPAKGAGGR